jgi:hypothetical protein
MKPIVYSNHATQMIAERTIAAEWVERTLSSPQLTSTDANDPTRQSAFRQINEFGGRWLRVVYAETPDALRVITTFFDRSIGKKP